jgi:hypothetical protein
MIIFLSGGTLILQRQLAAFLPLSSKGKFISLLFD